MADQPPLRQVEFGSTVDIELINEADAREPLTVTIVQEAAADLDQGLLSEKSPLARAILAKAVGTTVPYRMGDIQRVQILAARRPPAPPTTDAAARRQAILQKAISDAERTNAEIFAASYSGKWGDYELQDNQWKNADPGTQTTKQPPGEPPTP
jgi:hypothetical protein